MLICCCVLVIVAGGINIAPPEIVLALFSFDQQFTEYQIRRIDYGTTLIYRSTSELLGLGAALFYR